MRIVKGLSPVQDIYYIVKATLRPFLKALSSKPGILLRPAQLSDLFFSILWKPMGEGIDANTAELKTSLITPNASGVVLDVGAGKSPLYCVDDTIEEEAATEINKPLE